MREDANPCVPARFETPAEAVSARGLQSEEEETVMTTELAISRWRKAITADSGEQWRRPVEAEKAAVCALIDEAISPGRGQGFRKNSKSDSRNTWL